MFWVVGTSFLTSHYTIFDGEGGRIGFVENKFFRLEEPVAQVKIDHTGTIVIVLLVLLFILVVIALVFWRIWVFNKQTHPVKKKRSIN